MFKTLTALAFACATFAAPTFAQDVKAPTASVAPPVELPSSGLAAAGAAAGVGVLAIVAVAIVASDDDDSATATPATPGT